MSNEQLIDRIAKIPGENGWWTSAGQDTFESLGLRLVGTGMRPQEVIEVLEEAYWAVAEQFGA